MEFAELFVDYENVLEPTKENYEKAEAHSLRASIIEIVHEMDDEIDTLRSQLEVARQQLEHPSYYMDGHEMGQG